LLYSNNLRTFRYAETLLNYAELTLKAGEKQGVSAQDCLDKVRSRAKDGSIPVTLDNIKKERRREFVGEGLRFWDLIRWGDANSVLTETITELTPAGGTWSWSRAFTPEKKYLPFPEEEINVTKGTAYPLVQNPGW
jgi:Tfp pilus assembly protein PilX